MKEGYNLKLPMKGNLGESYNWQGIKLSQTSILLLILAHETNKRQEKRNLIF